MSVDILGVSETMSDVNVIKRGNNIFFNSGEIIILVRYSSEKRFREKYECEISQSNI